MNQASGEKQAIVNQAVRYYKVLQSHKKKISWTVCAPLKLGVLETRLKPETKPALELTYTQEFKTELGVHCIQN